MLSPLPELDLAIRIILAVVLGGLIGLDRESKLKPAGLRTHVLVCLGSALFTIISLSVFDVNVDSTRIAAGIVTGIGFLAAGAIFRAQDHIEGVTTAADIWVVAAIGMAVGFGYYFAAVLSAVIVFFVLEINNFFKRRQESQ